MGKIDHLDLITKHIYLAEGVRSYHPVDDVYKEIRELRRTNYALRGFDIPVVASGNVAKGGGKFTPRLATFRFGWKIVPEDISHVLYVTGEQITDEGEGGAACFDLEPLSASSKVIIQYEPPLAEVIEKGVSGLTEEESDRLMGVPTEPELAAVHGVGSWEGTTPTQLWNYDDRRLSSRDIESEAPGESLPSEIQVLTLETILNAIKGLGFESEKDTLRIIRQLVESAPPSAPKAHVKI